MPARVVRWSSIEFSERLPIVWLHARNREAFRLKFSSGAEMRQLVNTLRGALFALDRETQRKRREGRRALRHDATV